MVLRTGLNLWLYEGLDLSMVNLKNKNSDEGFAEERVDAYVTLIK